ncbi:MAG: hypothetical protein JXR77_13680 [Lentisphaeria bacterium]|nr:hypothetical protein [Lentisphaeria bacterium]
MRTTQRPEVHLICQAHIDPIWIWDWEEGLCEALATFEAAADLLDAFPDFVFNHNESLLYMQVRDYRPALFERIRAHVASGRWVITGGWYLQPDCNLPLGESFARQILLGREFFRREFGVEPRTALNFDSFGHHGNMPQFLRLAGYTSYVHFRPTPGEKDLPDFLYTWEGVDGSRVAALRPPCVWYCSHPASRIADKIQAMRDLATRRNLPVTCFWGAGNHGGGATRAELEQIRKLSRGTPRLRHGDLEAYCRDVVTPRAADQPPVRGELQKCFTGCYTSAIGVKLRNRRAEGMALAAERYAALAWWFLGEEYPAEALRRVWQDLLYCQFHDILPGSAIREGFASAAEIVGRSVTTSREVMLKAQLALARSRSPKRPLTVRVFNPHPVARRIPAILDIQLATHPAFVHGKHIALLDAQGRPLARQLLAYRRNTEAWRNTILFEAELCPCGIREYRIEIQEPPRLQDGEEAKKDMPEAEGPDAAASPEGFVPAERAELHDRTCTVSDHARWAFADRESLTVRADRIEATFSRATGHLISLRDRHTGREFLSAPSGSLLVRADTNNAWGGNQNAYGDTVAAFALPAPDDLAALCGQHDGSDPTPAVRFVASGPLATVVEVISATGRSSARTRYMIHRHQAYLDIEVLLNWQERCRALQLEFSTALAGETYLTEIPHAAIARTRGGGEEPCGRWTMLADGTHALALINHGTGGVEISGKTLRQSLVRSATFCAGNGRPKPGFMNEHMSLGEHIFRFRVAVGTEAEVRQALPFHADDLTLPFSYLTNIPLDPCAEAGAEAGTRLLEFEGDGQVHLEAIKRSEDGRALVVRLAERGGRPAAVTLRLHGAPPLAVTFGPYQMQTFRFERGAAGVLAAACDLLERPLPQGQA